MTGNYLLKNSLMVFRKLIIDSGLTMIMKVISISLKLILVISITNIFGAENYGAYSFAIAIFLFFNNIFRFGFDIYLHRLMAEKNDKFNKIYLQKLFGEIVSISFILLLFFSVVYFIFAQSLTNNRFLFLNYLIPFSCFYSFMWLYSYYLRGCGKGTKSVFLLEIFFPTLHIILLLILQSFFIKPVDILIYSFGFSIIFTNIFQIILDRYNPFYLLPKFELKIIKNHFRQGLPFLVISLSAILLGYVDIYTLGFFVSDFDIGIYSVALKISNFVLLPASAIQVFYSNEIVKFLEKRDMSTLKQTSLKILKILFIIGLLIFLFLNLLSFNILSLFGDEFTSASNLLLFLSGAYFVALFLSPYEMILIMSKRKKIVSSINILTILFNLLFNLPLIYYYGIYGASIGTGLALIINRFFYIFFVNRYIYK